jgi:hypothetical protein
VIFSRISPPARAACGPRNSDEDRVSSIGVLKPKMMAGYTSSSSLNCVLYMFFCQPETMVASFDASQMERNEIAPIFRIAFDCGPTPFAPVFLAKSGAARYQVRAFSAAFAGAPLGPPQ